MPVRVRSREDARLFERQVGSISCAAAHYTARLGPTTDHERCIPSTVDRLRLGERHGAESPAVVAPLDDDDVLLARRVTSKFDRRLNSFGTRVPDCRIVDRV